MNSNSRFRFWNGRTTAGRYENHDRELSSVSSETELPVRIHSLPAASLWFFGHFRKSLEKRPCAHDVVFWQNWQFATHTIALTVS